MSNDALHLDWRDTPTTNTTLSKIHRVLDEIDSKSYGTSILPGSLTGTPGAQLQLVDGAGQIVQQPGDDTTRMFVYKPKTIKKRAVEHLLKLAVVAKRLAQDIDKQVPVAQRLFGYLWKNRPIKKAKALELANSLALTIGVHPYVLGVIPAVEGRFGVPEGYSIKFTLCTNIFAHADGDNSAVQTRSVGASLDNPVPSLIISLKVVMKSRNVGRPRAILVCEHRNIKWMLSSLVTRGDKRFRGIFFVATGGYSDRGTREFLKMLCDDSIFDGVPCIFVSDRDPHAMEIFSNLKYGSRKCAYESRITAVNKIEWGGVSIERYRALAEAWPERELAKFKEANPQADQQMRQDKLAEFTARTTKAMLDSLKNPSARLNTSDKNLIKHFHAHKVFSEVHDNNLYQDLRKMGMSALDQGPAVGPHAVGEKFSLAKLCQLNVYGIEECVLDIIRDFNVAMASTVVQHVQMSQPRTVWVASGPAVSSRVGVPQASRLSESADQDTDPEAIQSMTQVEPASGSSPAQPVLSSAIGSQEQRMLWRAAIGPRP